MAKTMVIKGANYAANALDKVTFEESVPCTGISLEESSYNITNYTPVEVEYTVTPADTTDEVVWTSSDSDVITVSNGVITAVGIGTATITATCGNFSYTATVTVALPYIPNWKFTYIADNASVPYYSNSGSMARFAAFGAGSQAGEYVCLEGTGGTEEPVIVLPKNTNYVKVSVSSPTLLYNGDEARVCWTKDESCGASGVLAKGAKKVSEDKYNARSNPSEVFAVPSGADSFIFGTRLSSSQAEGTDPNTYAQTVGISFEFLAELPS